MMKSSIEIAQEESVTRNKEKSKWHYPTRQCSRLVTLAADMPISCVFGFHNWRGCRCSKCGKSRDEGHDWSKDCEKCICGKVRQDSHIWNGGRCSVCQAEDQFTSLVKRLGEDENTRAAATEALGKFGDQRAFDPLIRCMRDSSAEVRARACIALRTLGNRNAVPSLIDALLDDNEWVGKHAADALGVLGDERAIPALIKANENKTRFLVCCSAASALQIIQQGISSHSGKVLQPPPAEEPDHRSSTDESVPDFEQQLTQIIDLSRRAGNVQAEAVATVELRKLREQRLIDKLRQAVSGMVQAHTPDENQKLAHAAKSSEDLTKALAHFMAWAQVQPCPQSRFYVATTLGALASAPFMRSWESKVASQDDIDLHDVYFSLAIPVFLEIIEKDSVSGTVLVEMGLLYFGTGFLHRQRESMDKALSYIKQAIDAGPVQNDPQVLQFWKSVLRNATDFRATLPLK